MSSIIPAQQIPHDLDFARAEAKARARFDADHGEQPRRKGRPPRRRNKQKEGLEIDTFESTALQDSGSR